MVDVERAQEEHVQLLQTQRVRHLLRLNHLHGDDERSGVSPTEPLRRGELHNAEIVCDYAGQFRPGCWIFFGPGHLTNTKCPANLKENWNRKTMEILDKNSESCHLAIPGTTIFEQGNLRQNRKEKTLSTSRAVTTCACTSPHSSA